jgi:hypothetical protein
MGCTFLFRCLKGWHRRRKFNLPLMASTGPRVWNGLIRARQWRPATKAWKQIVYMTLLLNFRAIPRVRGQSWTFDTFEQSHLTSGEAFVIEAEDYNFDGGQYINNPDPSGIKESGQAVNSANGYLDQEGDA